MRILRGIILSVIVTAVSWNCNDAYASQKDKDIRELLDSPSVVEKFKKTQGKQTKKSKDKESPLVKEAKSFALYLNPPQKVEKRPPKIDKRTKSIVKKPTNASAKFEIVGTSYAESDPSMSLALLDIAGKGLRWIRQGETVGHLVIEEVKPGGTIVIRDGKNTSEMTVDKPVKMSLLKSKPPDMKELSDQIKSMLSAPSDLKSKTSRGVRPSASDKLKARPELSEEEVKQQELMMEQLLDQVGQMFKASKGADSSDTPSEKKPSAKDEVDKRRKVEKPQGETSDVQTVEEVSGLMDKLSEKLEQIKSNKNSTEVENIEKSVQQDAEHLRRAILKLKTTDVSPEDKGKLSALDKDLAKIQQNIRRSQSRKRIENIRNKSRR